METYQKRSLQSFRRVQGWLAAHPEPTATPRSAGATTSGSAGTAALGPIADMNAALGQAIQQLSNGGALQESHDRAARGATAEAALPRHHPHQRRELFPDTSPCLELLRLALQPG